MEIARRLPIATYCTMSCSNVLSVKKESVRPLHLIQCIIWALCVATCVYRRTKCTVFICLWWFKMTMISLFLIHYTITSLHWLNFHCHVYCWQISRYKCLVKRRILREIYKSNKNKTKAGWFNSILLFLKEWYILIYISLSLNCCPQQMATTGSCLWIKKEWCILIYISLFLNFCHQQMATTGSCLWINTTLPSFLIYTFVINI